MTALGQQVEEVELRNEELVRAAKLARDAIKRIGTMPTAIFHEPPPEPEMLGIHKCPWCGGMLLRWIGDGEDRYLVAHTSDCEREKVLKALIEVVGDE